MEFIKYETKQGDTLESIASQFKVNVDELISFHNRHASITQQIYTHEKPFAYLHADDNI